MKGLVAGVLGGLTAGALTSGAAVFGRDSGLLHKTLAENARDWVSRQTPVDLSTPEDSQAVQWGVHYLVAAGLGLAYGLTRPVTRFLPPTVAGALFGAGVYMVNVQGVAPAIGMTRGEDATDEATSRERLAVHIAFGVVTALVVAALAERD